MVAGLNQNGKYCKSVGSVIEFILNVIKSGPIERVVEQNLHLHIVLFLYISDAFRN